MTTARTKKTKPRASRSAPDPTAGPALLGPGLHGATLEMSLQPAPGARRAERGWRVRTLLGERLTAIAADSVEPALLDECLRSGRWVLLADTDRGPTILGALQTSRGVEMDADGTAVLRARTVRISAEKALTVEAGSTSIRLDESGAARAQGDRMVIDMGSHVRVLSALVELP
jgi:hypothetical protein